MPENKEAEKMTKAAKIRSLEMQAAFMRQQMLKAADALDSLRIENKELRERGDRLVAALDANDGTIDAQWKIGNAVSAWQEFND